MHWFRGGLACKDHISFYLSTLGSVLVKKRKKTEAEVEYREDEVVVC